MMTVVLGHGDREMRVRLRLRLRGVSRRVVLLLWPGCCRCCWCFAVGAREERLIAPMTSWRWCRYEVQYSKALCALSVCLFVPFLASLTQVPPDRALSRPSLPVFLVPVPPQGPPPG
jgi:hypothetical protein